MRTQIVLNRKKSGFIDWICQSECNNRTSIEIPLYPSDKSNSSRAYATKLTDYHWKLLHSKFGRWIVFFGLATAVCSWQSNVEFSKMIFWCFFRLPFNWRTPIGYLAAFTLPSLSTYSLAYSSLPIACFTIGSYLLIGVAIKITRNKIEISCSAIENGKELKEFFVGIISDITDLKELSRNSLKCSVNNKFSHWAHSL